VRIVPAGSIDRDGLHRSNLRCLREVLAELAPPAEACLVDGFRLGPLAPPHKAVVDGDTKSAAIAAASIVAKVVRDRVMRRLDAVHPRYGFASHVGYITPGHTAAVQKHGPCEQHRRSFNARAYADDPELELVLAEHCARPGECASGRPGDRLQGFPRLGFALAKPRLRQ
jgi:ribonuclease HII